MTQRSGTDLVVNGWSRWYAKCRAIEQFTGYRQKCVSGMESVGCNGAEYSGCTKRFKLSITGVLAIGRDV